MSSCPETRVAPWSRRLRAAVRPIVDAGLRAAAAALAAVAIVASGGLVQPVAAQPAAAPPAAARTGPQRVDAVEVELVADRVAAVPGGRIELGLRIRHDPHWHTYWRNPGDSGLATQVEPSGPDGTRFGTLRWPAPMRLWVGPLANYGYEDEVLLPFSAELPLSLAGPKVRLVAAAQWLVCKDVCVPGEARVAIELPVAALGSEPARSVRAALFDAAATTTPDPDAAIAGRAHREGTRLSLAFSSPSGQPEPRRVEFFPYAENVVSAPAPQALARTASGWRLDVELADGATPPTSLDGVLRIDDAVREVRATLVAGPAPTGTPVSVADRPSGLSKAGGPLLAGAGSSAAPGAGASSAASVPAPVDASLALALAFGLIGGVILNLMPCVFPVVGLKVLGFAQASAHAHGAHRAMRAGAIAFAAGVLLSFWLLGGAMLALRAAGESVGWGFQLQSPGFVAAMALLFVAVGLNFSGVFEFGVALTRLGGVGGASLAGSFGSGVLAVLVATPCTAPFMGSALGFTLAQPAAFTIAVFTAIGLGMALPYLVLGFVPGWVARMPRPWRTSGTRAPGAASASSGPAAWLAWVLVQQAGADAMLRLLLAAIALGAGAWAWGRWMNGVPHRPAVAWSAVAAAALAVIALLGPVLDAVPGEGVADAPRTTSAAPGSIAWETWSETRVSQALDEGRTVFVDFTAAWCVSCQANKKLVLERDAVAQAMLERNVLALRADWTQRDPAITAALARYGRNGVPLYLVMRPGEAQARVLPELLTTSLVVDAIR